MVAPSANASWMLTRTSPEPPATKVCVPSTSYPPDAFATTDRGELEPSPQEPIALKDDALAGGPTYENDPNFPLKTEPAVASILSAVPQIVGAATSACPVVAAVAPSGSWILVTIRKKPARV